MQFTDQDISGVRNAIEGIGPEHTYALAMQLRDGVIQIQILKREENYIHPIALKGHPFYSKDWTQVNDFLEKTFLEMPTHVMRASTWAGFSYSQLLPNIQV